MHQAEECGGLRTESAFGHLDSHSSDRGLLHVQGYVRSRVGSFTFWVRLPAPAHSTQRPSDGSRQAEALQQLGLDANGDGAGGEAAGGGTAAGSSGSGGDKTARPLVFLHGVGLGLVRLFIKFGQKLGSAEVMTVERLGRWCSL